MGISAGRYFSELEDREIARCIETAQRNGHSAYEADNCDDGSVGCHDCPFDYNTNHPEDGNP
uniref:Uncharacterized protein n=1 Tax=viral metagenome TaxID=1070528 RepID=A0A6M3IWX8_9ZZZZ